jgi:hypothetical protein
VLPKDGEMALASCVLGSSHKTMSFEVSCSSRKRDRDRERGSNNNNNSIHPPYKVVEITPPPKSLGVRCLPPVSNLPFILIIYHT